MAARANPNRALHGAHTEAEPAGAFSDLAYEERAYAIEADPPWEANEHGLWCINCGNHIAAPWNIEDGYEPPECCRECGFPEFGQ